MLCYAAQGERVAGRAAKMYAMADSVAGGAFYRNRVHPIVRSRMNAIFSLPSRQLEKEFVAAAEAEGLLHLYGHPVAGGVRVTMYNWVRDESVDKCVAFMRVFAERHADREL